MTVRFQERDVTAGIIAGVINSLRQLLAEDQTPIVVNICDGAQSVVDRLLALRHALGDVTQSELLSPRARRERVVHDGSITRARPLDLLGDDFA